MPPSFQTPLAQRHEALAKVAANSVTCNPPGVGGRGILQAGPLCQAASADGHLSSPLNGSAEFGCWSGACVCAKPNTDCTVEMAKLRSVYEAFARPDANRTSSDTKLGAGGGTSTLFASGAPCTDDCRVGPFSSAGFTGMTATADTESEFIERGGDNPVASSVVMCSFGLLGQCNSDIGARFVSSNRPPVTDDVCIRHDEQRINSSQHSQRTFEVRPIASRDAMSEPIACPFEPSTQPERINLFGPATTPRARPTRPSSSSGTSMDTIRARSHSSSTRGAANSGQFIGLEHLPSPLSNGPSNTLPYTDGFVFQAGSYEYTLWVFDTLAGSSVTTGW